MQIIDFGLASADAFPNRLAEDMAHKGFGTQRCELYDLHTLLVELREPQYAHLPQLRELLAASLRWVPARFFAKGPLFVEKTQRLSAKGQTQLQRQQKGPLDILLDDAYFSELRVESAGFQPQAGCDFS